MIDATGAIFVIGGTSGGNTFFNDVWKSTDGGADPRRNARDYETGTVGTLGVPRGVQRCPGGFLGRSSGTLVFTHRVKPGYSG